MLFTLREAASCPGAVFGRALGENLVWTKGLSIVLSLPCIFMADEVKK
jgi:hypothetical protein